MPEVFGFVKKNLSVAQRRNGATSGERGAGKGAAALVPASVRRTPERDKRSEPATTTSVLPTIRLDGSYLSGYFPVTPFLDPLRKQPHRDHLQRELLAQLAHVIVAGHVFTIIA